MSSRITKEVFIERAIKAHGDKYDYSKVEYVGITNKVRIICPLHGEFMQSPDSHTRGHGCPKCAGMEKGSTEEFIKKARLVHGNRYNYFKVVYSNNKTKVCIICPEHSEFWQTPDSHLRGSGCPQCGLHSSHTAQRKNKKTFINQAKKIHGDKYDYSEVIYENDRTNVDIVCREHGVFRQSPAHHLSGRGCPICAIESRKRLKYGIATNDMLNQEKTKCYKVWDGMLQRCYNPTRRKKWPSYENCTICKEWLVFSNFKEWFDENYIDGYHLDKDILSVDAKTYSPYTCAFIPPRLNTMLSHTVDVNGGVMKNKRSYAVSTTIDGVHFYEGGYNTEAEAHLAYAKLRLNRLFDTASEMFDEQEITEKVFISLAKKLDGIVTREKTVGIEIDEEYYEKAKARLLERMRHKSLFEDI